MMKEIIRTWKSLEQKRGHKFLYFQTLHWGIMPRNIFFSSHFWGIGVYCHKLHWVIMPKIYFFLHTFVMRFDKFFHNLTAYLTALNKMSMSGGRLKVSQCLWGQEIKIKQNISHECVQ